MKKIIIFLWVLLLPMKSFYAQSPIDSTRVFDNLKNWAITSLTIAYMEDLRGWSSKTSIEEISVERKGEFDTYQKSLESYNDPNEDIELGEFESLLEEYWGDTKDSVYVKFRDKILNNNSSFNDIPLYPIKEKINSNRKRALYRIQDLYSEQIQKSIEKKNESTPPLNIDEVTSESKNYMDSISYEWYIILFLIGINMLFLYKIIKNKKNIVQYRESNYREKYKEEQLKNQGLHRKIKIRDDKIEELKHTELREGTDTLQRGESKDIASVSQTENVENSTENYSSRNDEITQTIPLEVNSNIRTFYLPAPYTELRFANEEAREMELKESLYQVIYNTSTKNGELSICKNADLSRALNSPYKYLEPVCVYQNEYNSEADTITSNSVEIFQEEEDWVIREKLKIKFN